MKKWIITYVTLGLITPIYCQSNSKIVQDSISVHLLVKTKKKVIEVFKYKNGKLVGNFRDRKKTENFKPPIKKKRHTTPIFVQAKCIDSLKMIKIMRLSLLHMPKEAYFNGLNIQFFGKANPRNVGVYFQAKTSYSTSEVNNFQLYINQVLEILNIRKTW